MSSGFSPSIARRHPGTAALCFPCTAKGLLVRVDDGAARPLSEADVAALGLPPASVTWIGELGDQDCAAVSLPADFTVPAGFELRGVRSFFGAWPDPWVMVAGAAAQVLDFEATHEFCGRCGAHTTREPKERARRCPSCGHIAYPRISPAVIVLVRRGRDALLARSGRFPLPFYSTLAGFVEVGESLEATVVREIREEVGITVGDLRYFGSQPWPFPHSLMIAFIAQYAGGDIRVDGEEIVDARWFAPEALPTVPPPLSIARQMIDAWLADVRPPVGSP